MTPGQKDAIIALCAVLPARMKKRGCGRLATTPPERTVNHHEGSATPKAASGDNPVMLFDETSILVARAARGGVSGCVDGNGNAYRYFQIYDLSFGRGDKAGTASLRMRCIYNPTLGDTALEDFDTYDTSMKLTRKERMELKK